MGSSAIPGFYKKSPSERLEHIGRLAGLTEEELGALRGGGIGLESAGRMVENAVGTFGLPLGIATNFLVNGRDHLVPMAIEEPSVIAAASRGAKDARAGGGFEASCGPSYVTGQVQLVGLDDPAASAERVQARAEEILSLANRQSPTLSSMGKGAKELGCRTVDAPSGAMLLAEILVDAGDAMGANATNSMCEAVAPLIAEAAGGRALLRILSNYTERRLARASAVFPRDMVGGERAVQDMVLAYELAACDVRRAVTHNKGIMNGIIAAAHATGQDTRAIEAAAGAHAASGGRYGPLTRWSQNADGDLAGSIEVPMAVGTVGGVAQSHPAARACLKVAGASTAQELGCIIASAGLAQNYSAMRALVTGGIQEGHMRLHARNIAASAGATGSRIDEVARAMVAEGAVSAARAREILGK